jgi:hypothetical protein
MKASSLFFLLTASASVFSAPEKTKSKPVTSILNAKWTQTPFQERNEKTFRHEYQYYLLLIIYYLLFIIPSSPPSVSTWQFPEKSQITDEAENEFLNLPQILTHYTKMRSTSHLY